MTTDGASSRAHIPYICEDHAVNNLSAYKGTPGIVSYMTYYAAYPWGISLRQLAT